MVDSPRLTMLVAAIGAASVGCATSQSGSGPEGALAAYATAVREGDATAIHQLLDEATQARTTPEGIAALLSENAGELGEQAGEISTLATEGIDARAQVRLATGEIAVLVLEEEGWALDGGVLGVPTLRTPQDAILALRAALVRRSLRGALRVLAREPRSELEADIESLLEDTADELGMEVEILGNTARVRTSGGREIVLVREAGEWRVLEL